MCAGFLSKPSFEQPCERGGPLRAWCLAVSLNAPLLSAAGVMLTGLGCFSQGSMSVVFHFVKLDGGSEGLQKQNRLSKLLLSGDGATQGLC